MKPVERGREDLIVRGVRQQVAGELARDEFGVRHVVVERADHPVSPRPDKTVAVDLVAVGIAVARRVEPARRHALAVPGRAEQPIDDLLVGIGRRVREAGVDLFEGRGEAGEVEAHAPNQLLTDRLRRRAEARALEARQDEAVNLVPGPCAVLNLRQRRLLGRNERPVIVPLGPLFDPAADELDFPLGKGELRLGRRHAPARLRVGNPQVKLAFLRLSGDDHLFLGDGFEVEAKIRLALLAVGPVTGVTAVREERLDLGVEVHTLRRSGSRVLTHGAEAYD